LLIPTLTKQKKKKMTKTRSQTRNTVIKKEEEDGKTALLLNGISNTRRSSRITKRTPPIINNRRLPVQQVKMEEDTDIKPLLQSGSKSSKLPKGQRISQEQINQLVHYLVNDNMSMRKASRKVNISESSGFSYYKLYKNDPEKKIPSPRKQSLCPRTYCTQEQIENLIKYIDDDKMTLKEALAKTNVSYQSGHYYYSRYLKDPNHNIPVPRFHQYYTQDQRNEFIGYIIDDKISITAASKKAKISHTAAHGYYCNYFKVENPDIPIPSHIVTPKFYTQEQKKEVTGYIVDDRMTIAAASRKANVTPYIARRHYRQYLKDNNMKVPVLKKTYTQDDINKLIGYIVDDKMTITAASKKANISLITGRRYYHRHLHARKRDEPNRRL
jgi:transposase